VQAEHEVRQRGNEAHRLVGRVVLVTGGGRGIGRAIARRMAAEGASVAIADIAQESAEDAAEEMQRIGTSAIGFAADTTDREQVRAMVQRTGEELGGIDIAFNNAGVVENAPFLDLTNQEWDRMLATNARAVFACIQEEARRMIDQGRGGKIINTASIAGRHGSIHQSHYSASKFTVISLTQSAAKSLARHGITVNAMNPGIIGTHMLDVTSQQVAAIRSVESGRHWDATEVARELAVPIPLGRLGTPDDVAGLAFFLASSDADYITGQAINVCGGLVMD
jgi:meso-butanediol dehydrogenase/(S,S)-butanediol dehydrogenase/diacetyl reductase